MFDKYKKIKEYDEVKKQLETALTNSNSLVNSLKNKIHDLEEEVKQKEELINRKDKQIETYVEENAHLRALVRFWS
ncbi:hypothetical protein [Niallia sp. RD1]|uniref:hypothetical protein n=1 Tax=Niallia sp. RD1 TaxID=2962858 RepID=UPI0020C194D0|nr:hypothetical protein [Niallia sp. RD1]UTI41095.1 hypothetical protein NKG37_19865 [Niallia sp. RD1]